MIVTFFVIVIVIKLCTKKDKTQNSRVYESCLHGRVANALSFHSKGAGSISRQKVIFILLSKENFCIFIFLCGEHDGTIIFS
jgi:hypothetical protein